MHTQPKSRRHHSAELKAKVLAACAEPGASVAAVARAHDLNDNLVRKWQIGRGLKHCGAAVESLLLDAASGQSAPVTPEQQLTRPEFVALQMPVTCKSEPHAEGTPALQPAIEVQLHRGPVHLSVRWPSQSAADCTAWLSQLCLGFVK